MTEKICNQNSKKTSNEIDTEDPFLEDFRQAYLDHLKSLDESFLIQKALYHKEHGLPPLTPEDAKAFLESLRHTLKVPNSTDPIDSVPTLSTQSSHQDMQQLREFAYPHVEKAAQDRKYASINRMKQKTVENAISDWLSTLKPRTRASYSKGINDLIHDSFIQISELKLTPTLSDCSRTLFQFSNTYHDLVLEKILTYKPWSPSVRTRNASSYRSFIKFLEKETEGIISFLKEKNLFPKVRSNPSSTRALAPSEIQTILSLLKSENPRDYCLVKLYLHSEFKLCEILLMTRESLSTQEGSITYPLEPSSKQKHLHSYDVVSELQVCIFNFKTLHDDDLLFHTRAGKPIDPMQITRTLKRTFIKANIEPLTLKNFKRSYKTQSR